MTVFDHDYFLFALKGTFILIIKNSHFRKLFMSLFIKKIICMVYITPVLVLSQIHIDIPADLNIYINKVKYVPSQGWMDSLFNEALNNRIKYKIIRWHTTGNRSLTTLQIPQILTKGEVLRQVVLYYYTKSDQDEMKNDEVIIYPFGDIENNEEFIRCRYFLSDSLEFKIKQWTTITLTSEPTPEEKYLYDQIIEYSLESGRSWSNIPATVFKKIARDNHILLDSVKVIYHKVNLWKSAQTK